MQELTTDNFTEMASKGDVIVDFWAPWCGPCKMLGPIFEEVSKSHADVKFVKLNVDEQGMIAQQFGVRSIPTIVFLRNGKEVTRSVGLSSKQALDAKVREIFSAK